MPLSLSKLFLCVIFQILSFSCLLGQTGSSLIKQINADLALLPLMEKANSYIQQEPDKQVMVNIGFENSVLTKEPVRVNQAEVLRQLNQNKTPELAADFEEWLHLKTILEEQYRVSRESRVTYFDNYESMERERPPIYGVYDGFL